MDILCIGQAAYDITVVYPGPLVENQKYRAVRSSRCPGAPAFNAAALCARWGALTGLVARIGNDEYGELIRREAAAIGIDGSLLMSGEGLTTSYSLIAVDAANGSRTIINVPSSGEADAIEYPVEAPRVILFDGHEPLESLRVLDLYPQSISVVDAGTCREETLMVASRADYLICSEDFYAQYSGESIDDPADEDAIDRALKRIEGISGGVAVVTLGSRGLVFRDEAGRATHMPAYSVDAVDTTGAGDIFHGAAAFGLSRGWPFPKVLATASMASAISVESVGGFTSIPFYAQVMERLQRI